MFRPWKLWLLAGLLAAGCLTLLRAQRSRGTYSIEGEYFPAPAGAEEDTEFFFARLAYTYNQEGRWGPGAWMIDSPKAERHFLEGVQRLSNIHANPMERYFRATDPDLWDYPWLYAVEPGQWTFSPEEADQLREYLARGGILVIDDFHGTYEWGSMVRGLSKIIPDRPIVEIESSDAVFHTLYDLDERFQVPGLQFLYTGKIYEQDGVQPHWRGIYDDKGRLIVIINFNMDLGDSWEHADFPPYPEKYTALGYRLGINYIIYSMTH
ncbi:MAG: DUF4159 domain-containing protein [Acidobacteria bacterium]|nr:DUF4159 domain-containing protein [Acidobacteriota bacterium]